MSFDDIKEFCRETWKEDYIYLCIDISKKRDQGRYWSSNENKNTYTECIPETEPF